MCGKDLPLTLERIVENFGLATEDDSYALGAAGQPASEATQGSHVDKARQLPESHHANPTPEHAKVSGEATRTDDWGHKKTSQESSRGDVNVSRAVSRSQSKSSGTGVWENNRGSKQGKQVSRRALGKRDLKEMAMPKKKRLPRAADSRPAIATQWGGRARGKGPKWGGRVLNHELCVCPYLPVSQRARKHGNWPVSQRGRKHGNYISRIGP